MSKSIKKVNIETIYYKIDTLIDYHKMMYDYSSVTSEIIAAEIAEFIKSTIKENEVDEIEVKK